LALEKKAVAALDTDGDGKLTVKDLQHYWKKLVVVLTYRLPSSAGFTAGIILGLRHG
jgi:hypothetical protein